MKEWLATIKTNAKHHFVKDVAILQVGSGVSMILGFVASLVLARVFKPELYGQYVLIFSLVGLYGLFMNWGEGLSSSTLLAEAYNKKDRQSFLEVMAYYLKISLVIFVFVGLPAIITAPYLSNIIYHQTTIGYWSRIMMLANAALLIFPFLLLIFTVTRRIGRYAILDNLNKFITSLAIILAVCLGLSVFGVVYAQLIVALMFSVFCFFWYQKIQKKDDFLPSWSEIFKTVPKISFKKYFKFSLQIAIDKNIVNFRSIIPTLLLGYLAFSSEVAFYKIAFSYLALSSLLLSPIADLLNVQFPKTKIYGNQALKKRLIQTSLVGGLISIFSCLVFVIFAPFLVKFFYGQEYLAAIPVINVLAVNFSLAGFGLGLGAIFRVLKKVKYSIIVNSIVLLISLYPAWYAIKNYGTIGAAWWVGIIFITTLVIDFILISYFLNQDKSDKESL